MTERQVDFHPVFGQFRIRENFLCLIKKETGNTAQEYIQNRLIDTAKAK